MKEIFRSFIESNTRQISRRRLFGIASTLLLSAACGNNAEEAKKAQDEIQRAKDIAAEVYKNQKARGVDFSSGPCLADPLMDNWVLDIAHSPRLPIDDRAENQCQGFKDGKYKRFIELDPEGKFIQTN